MQIRKRLQLQAVLSVLSALAIAAVLMVALHRLNQAHALSINVSEILIGSLELVSLRDDYIWNGNERAKEQYLAKTEQNQKLLIAVRNRFKDSEYRKVVDEMLANRESSREIFMTIVATREKSPLDGAAASLSQEVEKRLLTQLNMRVYERIMQCHALQQSSKKAGESALKLAEGGILALIIIIAAALSHASLLRRTITNRIGRLHRGAAVIGDGDLQHRIDMPGNDEFADLASTFNMMTGKLSRVYQDLQVEIAERKKAEELLQTVNDSLERKVEQRTFALQEMQQQYLHAEKLSAIGKLSASIAHEFNSPLQSVMTVLKGLQKTAALDENDGKMLVLALGESERMKNLIQSLSDFYRPSAGRKVFMHVHQSIESVLMLIRKDLSERRISVECRFAESLPKIQAIPDQIKQVIINLLMNAMDACIAAGGKITVTTWQEGARVAVAIQDTGVGIRPENMDNIFRPFFSTKSEVKGTGLGLAVSYGIVKNHHGEIKVESQPGKGAKFIILLPIKDPG